VVRPAKGGQVVVLAAAQVQEDADGAASIVPGDRRRLALD
jgi:acyl CoA:acetate/3-ketoacid CoA transferase beta subunit